MAVIAWQHASLMRPNNFCAHPSERRQMTTAGLQSDLVDQTIGELTYVNRKGSEDAFL